MFIMAYNDYEAVKLVTAARPNLGFYSHTPAPCYLLRHNLPDKTGEKGKWNLEKAHSILHKVREIVLWGNSDNTSCQAVKLQRYVLVHSRSCLICTGTY